MIASEDSMPTDFVVKSLPGIRLVARRATLQLDTLGEHIGPMFDAVAATIGHIPGALATPMATYSVHEGGMDVVVGYAYAGDAPPGTEAVELAPVEAVCGVHLGPMVGIGESWQALHRWIVDNGYGFAGPCRELYVRAVGEDQSDWVTELQQPITR